jgi:hypothetical protein
MITLYISYLDGVLHSTHIVSNEVYYLLTNIENNYKYVIISLLIFKSNNFNSIAIVMSHIDRSNTISAAFLEDRVLLSSDFYYYIELVSFWLAIRPLKLFACGVLLSDLLLKPSSIIRA